MTEQEYIKDIYQYILPYVDKQWPTITIGDNLTKQEKYFYAMSNMYTAYLYYYDPTRTQVSIQHRIRYIGKVLGIGANELTVFITAFVKVFPSYIVILDNPSEELQDIAYHFNPALINDFHNPSEKYKFILEMQK